MIDPLFQAIGIAMLNNLIHQIPDQGFDLNPPAQDRRDGLHGNGARAVAGAAVERVGRLRTVKRTL